MTEYPQRDVGRNRANVLPYLPYHRGLALICFFFVLLAWVYGLVLPPFENLDEVEHFSAIRYVAETGSLPVHDPAIQEQYHYRQEASQPPLYYLLMGGLARLLGLSTGDANAYLANNPFVACGPSDQSYNRHALYHNPSREAPPWHGALLALHLLRALSPLLQVVTVVGVYAIARLVLPRRPGVALLATALTAFNPQFLLVASGVNNDNLVTPLATLGVYLALRTCQRGLNGKRSAGLGLLAGLAALSKLSGLLLLGLIGLVLLKALWRSHRPQYPIPNTQYPISNTQHPQIFLHGLLIATITVAVCGWWFWRNVQLYGDPTALAPMLDLVGRRAASALPLNESGLMFRSFWGQLACTFFGNWLYLFFGLLTTAGLIGLLWGLRHTDRPGRLGMLFLALWFGITFTGWLRWGAITAATGGRLLFPAIASTSTLLAYGLLSLWPAAWRGRVAAVASALLALVALATLLWELRPLFAPPRTYAEDQAPATPHPLDATFDSSIRLLGYAAEVQPHAPHLDVTFYWQALAPIPRDYALAIQLTSPIPGDDSLRFNYNTWPGRGNYPTSAWPAGRVVADRYRFRLPTSDALTQAWQLLVAFYELESGERLPVRLDGQDVGDSLILTTLRVPGRSPTCPAEGALAEPVSFERAEEKISLTAATADVFIKGEPQIKVSLCWKSLAPVPLDYTVFVHLYDENGALIATGDGPPMDGAFPTRLWQAGDVIADAHTIHYYVWPPEKWDHYHIGVGLYDPLTGERLKAVQFGQPLPNNVVFLDTGP